MNLADKLIDVDELLHVGGEQPLLKVRDDLTRRLLRQPVHLRPHLLIGAAGAMHRDGLCAKDGFEGSIGARCK